MSSTHVVITLSSHSLEILSEFMTTIRPVSRLSWQINRIGVPFARYSAVRSKKSPQEHFLTIVAQVLFTTSTNEDMFRLIIILG